MSSPIRILPGLLMVVNVAFADAPEIQWSRTFGEFTHGGCRTVLGTADGGYLLFGNARKVGSDPMHSWMIRTDNNGDSLWSRTFDGNGQAADHAHGGRFILTGTKTFPQVAQEGWIAKTDHIGRLLWERTHGGPAFDVLYSVKQTFDGGYAMAGTTTSFGAGGPDFWLVKTDAVGDCVWTQFFGGDSTELCRSMIQTSDSGFLLVGETTSLGAGERDFWVVKTNRSGIMEWSRTFGGDTVDICRAAVEVEGGGYLLGGSTCSFGAGFYDMWVVKINANGDSLWSRTYGMPSNEHCYAIQPNTSGGFLLAGNTISLTPSWDVWMVCINAAGDSLWSQSFGTGGDGGQGCLSIARAADGGSVLGGNSSVIGSMIYDRSFLMVKLCGPDQQLGVLARVLRWIKTTILDIVEQVEKFFSKWWWTEDKPFPPEPPEPHAP